MTPVADCGSKAFGAETMRLGTKHGKPSPAAIVGVDLLGEDVLILDAAGKRFGWR